MDDYKITKWNTKTSAPLNIFLSLQYITKILPGPAVLLSSINEIYFLFQWYIQVISSETIFLLSKRSIFCNHEEFIVLPNSKVTLPELFLKYNLCLFLTWGTYPRPRGCRPHVQISGAGLASGSSLSIISTISSSSSSLVSSSSYFSVTPAEMLILFPSKLDPENPVNVQPAFTPTVSISFLKNHKTEEGGIQLRKYFGFKGEHCGKEKFE